MTEPGACPVCDGTSFVQVYPATFAGEWRDAVPYFLTGRRKALHGRIVRCVACGFVFTSPQFSAEEYADIYATVNASGQGTTTQARFDALARRVRRFETGGSFLDFGCGNGAFLDAMPDFDGIGFEVGTAGLRRNGRIITGNIMADCVSTVGLSAESFDFIVAWDVLEHLAAPAGHMRRLRDLLKPGGRLYLTLPDSASWVGRVTGEKWNMLLLEHLWYFNPETIRRFLDRCGLVVSAVTPIPYPVDLATVFRRTRQTYGEWIPIAPAFFARFVVRLPIGLMFVVAHREGS